MDDHKKAKIGIWTIELTLQLYRDLVKHFGPHRDWGRVAYPIDAQTEYDHFCETFAALHGAKSSDAVKMQIAWAIGCQPIIKNRHNMRNIFRNKLCAWDVDFIDGIRLPAWTINFYVDVKEKIKDATRDMMNTYLRGFFVDINSAMDIEKEEE